MMKVNLNSVVEWYWRFQTAAVILIISWAVILILAIVFQDGNLVMLSWAVVLVGSLCLVVAIALEMLFHYLHNRDEK